MRIRRVFAVVLFAMTAFVCVACTEQKSNEENSVNNSSEEPQVEIVDVMQGWKEADDPRGVYPPEGTQTGETRPQIVETKYETEDVVVADIIPTEMGYAVDPTGATDSTEGIQRALSDCYMAGGGTVYLPAGNYAITETITIPSFVTLYGDWQDPDEGTGYGTVFSIWMDPGDETQPGAFRLNRSSGIVGMTVYYPFQSLYEVLEYPYTFYLEDSNFLFTLRNITVINGYRGIGSSVTQAHASLMVNNFKGTFLCNAMELYNSGDVGAISNVSVSPRYWAEAAAAYMNAPIRTEIDKYMEENTTGLVLSDLEWSTFRNISVDSCSVGIQFVAGYRINFVGSMLDVNLTNCDTGILSAGIDERWGMNLARSHIEGGINNEWIAKIRTTDMELTGDIREVREGTVERNDTDLSAYEYKQENYYTKPKANLKVAELTKGVAADVSAELQAVLDAAGKEGGGIVYVPGGTYRFDKAVTVPAGVQLRGATIVSSREESDEIAGTRFICYYGDGASYDADTDPAFITLAGENAGINGLHIVYARNGSLDENVNTTYAVRGTASGVYMVNSFIVAAGYGVDFRNCDDHYVSRIFSGCYYNAYYLGGKNGVIDNCLDSGNVIAYTQNDYLENWAPRSSNWKKVVYDVIRRARCQTVIIENAENQLVLDTFAYGARNLITNKNAKNTLAINVGLDNGNALLGMLQNQDADMTVINLIRSNGHTYDNRNGDLAIYNPTAGEAVDLEKNIVLTERSQP